MGEKSKCEASDNKVHLVVLFRSHYGQQGLQDFTILALVTFRFRGKYICENGRRSHVVLKFGSTVRRYREKGIGPIIEPWGTPH